MDYRYVPFYVQGNAVTGIYYGQWGMAEDRDIDYVKEMYPLTFSRIQELVEFESDRQEFAGSMMFDEYPDRLMLKQIVDRIFQAVSQPQDFEAEQYEAVEANELRMVGPGRPPGGGRPPFGPPPGPPPFGPPPGPPRPPRPPKPNHGLQNLIEVLLYNEMYNRRCRHRRCRRWW